MNAAMSEARDRFQALRKADGIIVQPVVFNPLTARIAESLGFEAIGLGGYALGAALALSEPLVSIGDLESATLAITRVSDLPLMVDAGAGYGEPVHVRGAVRRLEHVGATSIHIEDQVYPKRVHYHAGVEHVVPIAVMVRRIEAAVQARIDRNFVIVARTDAMATDGYDEGIQRARLYREAGADMIMIFPNNEDETRRVPRDLPDTDLIYVNSSGNRLGRGVFRSDLLEEWGWKVVSDAILTTNVAAAAAWAALDSLRRVGVGAEDECEMRAVRKRIEDVIGLDALYDIEKRTVEDS